MASSVLVPLAEYLSTTTDPDCEYLDGQIVERNVGEISHGDAQTALAVIIRVRFRGFWAGVEIRVQVREDRFRVPDVVIVRGGRPTGRIITDPPEVAVEVLSPEDRAGDVQDKIDDYLRFGVACVWVLDPEKRRGWMHTGDGSKEAKDGMLRNPAGDLEVPLSEVYAE